MRDPLRRDDELERAISVLESPRARAGFRSGLRSALLASAASEEPEERPSPRPRRTFALAFAPRYVLAVVAIVAVALGSTGAAAASSLPGEPLFAVKVVFEQVELVLASDDPARVVVLSRQASRRLGELEHVAADRPELAPTASQAYQDSVARFRAAVEALRSAPNGDRHDLALEVADRATKKHLEVLESVRERGDADVEEAIEKTKELKDKVEEDKRENDDRKRGHDGSDERRGDEDDD